MITLYCWDVNCEIDGARAVWATEEPTTCPIDPDHTVDSVEQGNFHQAHSVLTLNDGAGRVFAITVDANGNLNASQIHGDPPPE